MTKKKPTTPKQLEIVVRGDRRTTESVILEVRDMARKFGLKVPRVQILPQSSIQPKRRKPGSLRKRDK